MKEQKLKVLLSEDVLEERIRELAGELNQLYQGESLHLIGILKGSVFFLCDLAKHLTMPVTMDFMKVSSYGSDTVSSGNVEVALDVTEDIKGRHVLIVEDIIDSGLTLAYLKKHLMEKEPKSLRSCTLLDKPERRTVEETKVDFTGFVIEDQFVVGYGLDYAQQYRNLPYIGIIEQS